MRTVLSIPEAFVKSEIGQKLVELRRRQEGNGTSELAIFFRWFSMNMVVDGDGGLVKQERCATCTSWGS